MTEYKREAPKRMCDGVLEIKDINQWTVEHHLAEALRLLNDKEERSASAREVIFDSIESNILSAWWKVR